MYQQWFCAYLWGHSYKPGFERPSCKTQTKKAERLKCNPHTCKTSVILKIIFTLPLCHDHFSLVKNGLQPALIFETNLLIELSLLSPNSHILWRSPEYRIVSPFLKLDAKLHMTESFLHARTLALINIPNLTDPSLFSIANQSKNIHWWGLIQHHCEVVSFLCTGLVRPFLQKFSLSSKWWRLAHL